jgi:hypothetical protein
MHSIASDFELKRFQKIYKQANLDEDLDLDWILSDNFDLPKELQMRIKAIEQMDMEHHGTRVEHMKEGSTGFRVQEAFGYFKTNLVGAIQLHQNITKEQKVLAWSIFEPTIPQSQLMELGFAAKKRHAI